MEKKTNPLGILSALGTFGLIAYIAHLTGVFPTIKSEALLFLSGHASQITKSNPSLLLMLPIILGVIAIKLPASMGASILQGIILGKSGKHAISESFSEMEEGNHLFQFFLLVIGEELFARWLFLDLLPNTFTKELSGPIAFYLLFFVGNGLWAYIHLSNFENKKDRKLLRVLPQFIGGIFFTYIFIKFGLLATILTHFASNAVLFAFSKTQRITPTYLFSLSYALISALVSYQMMEKPLTDIFIWFADKPLFEIPGWNFWDYLKVSVFISSCSWAVFSLLLYDQDTSLKTENEGASLKAFLIGSVVMVGLFYLTYWALGFVIEQTQQRVIIVALLLSFLIRTSSPSELARAFWMSLPSTYLSICIMQALGFWPAVGWVIASAVVRLPYSLFAPPLEKTSSYV